MRKFLSSLKKLFIVIEKLLTSRWFLVPTIIVFLALGLFIALKSYIAPLPTDFNQRKEFIQLLAQILGGALLLIGLYLTWRRVEVAQEGQITERFTRAIDQLGSDKLEIRLGGIYALERLSRDSKKDHWQIMEVLTAYVRENARWNPDSKNKPTGKGKKSISHPTTDVQAILTVLGRREPKFRTKESRRLNIMFTNLQKANLTDAHLERAEFRFAHMEEASLYSAHLEGAVFIAAKLEGARCWEAHLEGATFWVARLKGAEFTSAYLNDADFRNARLERVDFSDAQLKRADLIATSLKGAILKGADLRGAILLRATGLTKEQIESAHIDKNTELPDYLESLAKSKKRGKQDGNKKGTISKGR